VNLFKVRLTDGTIKNRQQMCCTFIVMAIDAKDAYKTLHDENPAAFTFNPEVTVEPYEFASVKLACLMVPRREGRQYGKVVSDGKVIAEF
jgi:hypothetical protein